MDVHDVCSIFPMMSDDEFTGLKADIAANGQRYKCPGCGDLFYEPVWCCPECQHHWPLRREDCWNCHHQQRPSLRDWLRGFPHTTASFIRLARGTYLCRPLKVINGGIVFDDGANL